MPRDASARGLRVPRRRCAAALRPAAARGDPALRCRDRGLPRAAGREADRRRVQLGDRGGAARPPAPALRSGHRRARPRGARRGARDAQPPDRAPRHRGHGRERALPVPRALARRGRRGRVGRVPAARPAHRGRRPVRRGDHGRGARVRGAAQAGRRRYGDPRLHALPAHPPDPAARVRARSDAGLLGGGDRARGRRDARAQGHRERRRAAKGSYRFLTTGDPELFREMGRRFLQLPIDAAEHVEVATLEAVA